MSRENHVVRHAFEHARSTDSTQHSFSAFRLTVRSVLPSLSASTASSSSSLLLQSFRRCTLLSKARGTGYAHVPGTIDELTATDTFSSRSVSPLRSPLIFLSNRLVICFKLAIIKSALRLGILNAVRNWSNGRFVD